MRYYFVLLSLNCIHVSTSLLSMPHPECPGKWPAPATTRGSSWVGIASFYVCISSASTVLSNWTPLGMCSCVAAGGYYGEQRRHRAPSSLWKALLCSADAGRPFRSQCQCLLSRKGERDGGRTAAPWTMCWGWNQKQGSSKNTPADFSNLIFAPHFPYFAQIYSKISSEIGKYTQHVKMGFGEVAPHWSWTYPLCKDYNSAQHALLVLNGVCDQISQALLVRCHLSIIVFHFNNSYWNPQCTDEKTEDQVTSWASVRGRTQVRGAWACMPG